MDEDCDCPETEIPPGALYGEFQIINKKGLHARATAKFVQCAARFDADLTVSRCGETVGATSIMGVLTLGAGIGSEFDVEECNYSKIIIMTDADTDGAHIQVLLLTFFYRYMKPLIDAGKVFIAQPPLYKITRKSGKLETVRYAWTDEQLNLYTKELGKGAELQRYKGLGEINPDQLWETTMNYESRTFLQVQIEDAAKAERRVSTLMGDKVDPRKRWIIENVDFTEYEE